MLDAKELSQSMLETLKAIYQSHKRYFFAFELSLNKRTLESLRKLGYLDKKLFFSRGGLGYKYYLTPGGWQAIWDLRWRHPHT